jgi:hypothetical protein
MEWINVDKELPTNYEYVLIYVPKNASTGYNNVKYKLHMAQFVKGKVPKDNESISAADKYGNNKVPYKWEGDGPMSWFGQEVTKWCRVSVP